MMWYVVNSTSLMKILKAVLTFLNNMIFECLIINKND